MALTRPRAWALALGLAATSVAVVADADNKLVVAPTTPIEARPHTIAEADLGVIALPGAPVSASRRGGDVPFVTIGRGDATLLVGLKALARVSREFELGAGLRFGPSPTTDDEYGGATGLRRTHSRSYMLISTEARYIPFRWGDFEGWMGAIVGLTVIADRYTTQNGASVPTILGERTVTIRSEGLSIGAQGGVLWNLSDHWVTGFMMRTSAWMMPRTPRCSPIGDCATLSGPIVAIEGGLTLGYRVPL
jgi:hypothetical protein